MGLTNAMTTASYLKARKEIKTICSSGPEIELIKPLTKDELGENLTESSLIFNAFPIRFTPFDREIYRKISWADNCDIIVYLSAMAVEEEGYTLQRLRRYNKLRFNNTSYDIKYIENYSAFYTGFLYVVIGGKK